MTFDPIKLAVGTTALVVLAGMTSFAAPVAGEEKLGPIISRDYPAFHCAERTQRLCVQREFCRWVAVSKI